MPITGPHRPTAAACVDLPGGVDHWEDVSGVLGGCPAYVVSTGGTSHGLLVTGFNIAVPAAAKITYVGVTARVRDEIGDGVDVAFRLAMGGEGVGLTHSHPDGIGDSYRTAERGGDPTTFWGCFLTPAEINDPSFGVVFVTTAGSGNTVYCDGIEVVVAYVV